jgi:hypothetical protein
MHKIRLSLLALVYGVILAGCQTLGFEQPRTFNDRVAYTYQGLEAVVRSTSHSLEVGAISVQDAQFVSRQGRETIKYVGLAETAYNAGDISTAEGRLAFATELLLILQTYSKPGVER